MSSELALYGLWGGNAPWFMCWFWHCINCFCIYLTFFLTFFFPFFPYGFFTYLLSSYSFTSWVIYLFLPE